MVKRKMNPIPHIIGGCSFLCCPNRVISHLKILTPVGIAMIIVVAVKYLRVSESIPTVYMWWAHTMNPSSPILAMA